MKGGVKWGNKKVGLEAASLEDSVAAHLVNLRYPKIQVVEIMVRNSGFLVVERSVRHDESLPEAIMRA